MEIRKGLFLQDRDAGLFPSRPRSPYATHWRRCQASPTLMSAAGTAFTARTAVSALHGPAAKAYVSTALKVMTVLGVVGSGAAPAGSVNPQWIPGPSMVAFTLLTLVGPLGGGLYCLLRNTWERMEPYVIRVPEADEQEPSILHGVDVTGSEYFSRPSVLRAVEFAAAAHQGQVRKTGEPYVTHCIETALIVEDLLSPTENEIRAEAAVIAAVLHDVIDDTHVTLEEVEGRFGKQIASMVSKVSQLSQTNQLVRRRLRLQNAEPTKEDEDKLQLLILTMVMEPLVIVIKLADRLHNMRTVYALPADKQQAVAQETRTVWCTLAERLGIIAIKSELEDLCFAVLQPREFRWLRDAVFQYCRIPEMAPEFSLDGLSEGSASPPADQGSIAGVSGTAASTARCSASPATQSAEQVMAGRTKQTPSAVAATTPSLATAADPPDAASSTGSSGGRGGAYMLGDAGVGERGGGAAVGSTEGRVQGAVAGGRDASLDSTLSVQAMHSARTEPSAATSGGRDEVGAQGWAPPACGSGDSVGDGLRVQREGEGVGAQLRPWPQPDPLDALPHSRPRPDSIWVSRDESRMSRDQPHGQITPPTGTAGHSSVHLDGDSTLGASAPRLRGLGISGNLWAPGRESDPSRTSHPPARPLAPVADSDQAAPAGQSAPSSTAGAQLDPQQLEVKELLESVLPFHASTFNMSKLRVTPSARRGLEVLQQCAMALLREIALEGYASGLEVSVEGRLKSMYSIFKKMSRKGVPVSQVYDARALRVVVGDAGGLLAREAAAACYKLMPAVHRLWRKIPGEQDDYMVTPKPSGYQSLHTAVRGPGGVPMEVQIRTASMHEDAEYGKAAHWAYKERPTFPGAPGISKPHEIRPGDPLLQIGAGGRMRQGTVLEVQQEGLRLLVALSFLPAQSTDGGVTRPPSPELCSQLEQYVGEKKMWASGFKDSQVAVELYVLGADGKFHRMDHFGHIQKDAIVIPTKHSARSMQSMAGGGGAKAPEHRSSGKGGDGEYMDNRIRLLRSMLEWQREDISGGVVGGAGGGRGTTTERDSVIVLVWPQGKFLLLPKGTTAGEVVARHSDGVGAAADVARRGAVIVNNQPVGWEHSLDDGDYVVLSQELPQV